MKKNGIKKPNPTASSLDSNLCAVRSFITSRTIRPAANAPRITSRPRDDASTTRPTTRTTASLTEYHEPEHEHDGQPHRLLTARVQRPLQKAPPAPDRPTGGHRGDDRERTDSS